MWDQVVQQFTTAVGDATKLLFSFWTKLPSPVLGTAGGDPIGPVKFLRDSTSWYVGALAVAACLVGAARIAITHRGEHAAQLTQAMLRLVAATFLGIPVVQALLVAGDRFTDWVLANATGGDFSGRLVALGEISQLTGTAGVSSALVFLLALMALIATLAQMAFMFVRAGMLVLLVSMLPLSATLTNTEGGKAWWTKTTGWLLAFVLFKPVAAIVYAAAFASIGQGKDVMSLLGGMFLLALAALTLPALMRLAVPATAAVASGGGSGAGFATVGALATGAMAMGQATRTQASGASRTSTESSAGLHRASGSRPTGDSGGSAGPAGGGRGPTGGTGPGPSGGTAAPSTGAAASAGGGSTAGAAAGAAGSGAAGAAAAGPAAPVVLGVQAAAAAGSAASGALRQAGQDAAGEGEQS